MKSQEDMQGKSESYSERGTDMGCGFIIDTDSYSGNFEREMCAYITGHIGDCLVGFEEAEDYLSKYEKIKGVVQKENITGMYRPVEIIETPDIWNNGMGFHFRKGEEDIALKEYRQSIKRYYESEIKRLNGAEAQIERYKREINESLKLTKPKKHKAFQSVLIHFECLPCEETINFMKQRAFEFAKNKGIKIEGFRTKVEGFQTI
ncbi:hypothetical protein ACTWKC_17650 [Bacillus sp. 4A_MP3]|uniref:hypothetical protein n=1 Tax=Bacillus velezensis TaxID=492670 RepID=UPI001EEBB71C|nr:hypothetical protein [Bacillus velezensis]